MPTFTASFKTILPLRSWGLVSAGRIAFQPLTPFLLSEVSAMSKDRDSCALRLWLRGGFPPSFLSQSEESSLLWRENFVQTFGESGNCRPINLKG
jgi:hypothetical protein